MSNFVHILSYTATTDEVPFPNVSEKDRSLPKYFLLKDRPTQNFLQTKNKNIFFLYQNSCILENQSNGIRIGTNFQ